MAHNVVRDTLLRCIWPPLGPLSASSKGGRASGTDGTGCFDVIDNSAGYLIIQRALAKPSYGLFDFAVIDFGASPPTITELVEGDTPPGKSKGPIVLWKANGFSLRYYGLPVGAERESGKPALHELSFDFGTKKITQVK